MRPHTHKCHDCGRPFACDGTFARNHDGFPETICSDFHTTDPDDQRCVDCVERAVKTAHALRAHALAQGDIDHE